MSKVKDTFDLLEELASCADWGQFDDSVDFGYYDYREACSHKWKKIEMIRSVIYECEYCKEVIEKEEYEKKYHKKDKKP